jgi:hypothetical protein
LSQGKKRKTAGRRKNARMRSRKKYKERLMQARKVGDLQKFLPYDARKMESAVRNIPVTDFGGSLRPIVSLVVET